MIIVFHFYAMLFDTSGSNKLSIYFMENQQLKLRNVGLLKNKAPNGRKKGIFFILRLVTKDQPNRFTNKKSF